MSTHGNKEGQRFRRRADIFGSSTVTNVSSVWKGMSAAGATGGRERKP